MATIPTNTYGLQLILDGYAANPEYCGDVERLYSLLMKLPETIGMRRVGFPHIIHITEEGIKGLSGFVFIMESHISIHTYEERGFVTIDVYSCKTFDETAVIKELKQTFGVTEVETNVLIRGSKFNHMPTDRLARNEQLVG